MERGIRPITGVVDPPMLHRVEVNVLDVRAHIPLIAQQPLPIPPLPDPTLLLRQLSPRAPFLARQPAGKQRLNMPPPRRIVGITLRETPDAMKMLGQHHYRHDLERPRRPRRPKRLSQQPNMLHQQRLSTIQQIHGEEIHPSRHPHATIVRHAPACRPTGVPPIRDRRAHT